MKTKYSLKLSSAALVFLALGSSAFAVTASWTNGASDNKWETAGNWNPNQVPTNNNFDVSISIAAPCNLSNQYGIGALNLSVSSAILNLVPGSFLSINSAAGLTNNGTIVVNTTGANTATKLRFDGDCSITGTGSIQLKVTGNVFGAAVFDIATHIVTLGAGQTLRGDGTVVSDNGRLINNGTIIGDDPSGAMQLDFTYNSSVLHKNNGTIKATNGGILGLYSGILDQSGGGTLRADGAGSSVQIGAGNNGGVVGATVIGGTLDTSSGGVIQTVHPGNGALLKGCTNNGTIQIPGGDAIFVRGTGLINNGTILINSNDPTGSTSTLEFDESGTLDGTGTVTLHGVGFNHANLKSGGGGTLTIGANQTVRGYGNIFTEGFVNNGTVIADDPAGNNIQIGFANNGATNTNNATLKAINGGVLGFYSGVLNQTSNGFFLADGSKSIVQLGDVHNAGVIPVINGGALRTANGGVIHAEVATIGGSITSEAKMEIPAAGTLRVGTAAFTNNGTLTALASDSQLRFDGSATLSGTGSITLNSGKLLVNNNAANTVTNNPAHTIKGIGTLQVNSGSSFVNDGILSPGLPIGELDCSGDLRLNAFSNLVFEVGGTSRSVSYDWLNKTDSVPLKLNGLLTVQLVNNFVPSNSDTFTILTSAAQLSGAFSNVPSGSRLRTADSLGSFKVTYSGTNSVTLSEFQVNDTLVVPSKGGNAGTVTATIYAKGIPQNATIRLTATGQPDVVGRVVSVSADGSSVVVMFDLAGQTLGKRDVVIAGSSGTLVTIVGGFTIEQSTGPQLWVDVIGRTAVPPHRPITYTIAYGNRGDADRYDAVLMLHIPKGASVTSLQGIGVPPGTNPIPGFDGPAVQTKTETLLPCWFYIIPAGTTRSIVLTVNLQDQVAPDSSFTITAEFLSPQPAEQDFVKTGDVGKMPFWYGKTHKSNPFVFAFLAWQAARAHSHSGGAQLFDPNDPNFNSAACINDTLHNAVFQSNPDQGPFLNPYAYGTGIALRVVFDTSTAACFGSANGGEETDTFTPVPDPSPNPNPTPTPAPTPPYQGTVKASLDPNEKDGPQGTGTQRYISGEHPSNYAIFFENKETASAPAQTVVVTDQINTSQFDLSTFAFGTISFGNNGIVTPLPTGQSFLTDVDLRPAKNLIVRVTGILDQASGIVTWTFTSLDPATGRPPDDVQSGFLPPNKNGTEGAGTVNFSVAPNTALPSGSQITNQARIVFDQNPAMDTNVWQNTISKARLLNVSTRMQVLIGEQVLIGGFIVTGNQPKKILVRGLGPSLGQAGISNALADPLLELHSGAATLQVNDNWQDDAAQAAQIRATGIPPQDPRESAIVMTLNPGTYTAVLRGKANGVGIGLVEVYDLDQSADAKLANISTRGYVDTGDNVMIGGFIAGTDGARYLIRAIGPSLASSGVTNTLGDPTLELFNGNGTAVATNDNWKQDQEAEIRATTIPPTNDLESALLQTLPPGNYTAVVRGKNSSTGIGLVEVYNLQ